MSIIEGTKQAATDRLRVIAGPAYRRVKREIQWRRCGADLALERGPVSGFPWVVMAHETPLIRPLSGLEHRLQVNKVTNLRLAIEPLDGRVLQPGQRLSVWWFVRAPTARRGFLEGLVLSQGRLTAGVGGGLCQLTNLIHWMTIHTPLTVVERWRHTYDVFPDAGRTQPFASGATCSWPSLDLQIENRTATAYRLGLRLTGQRWNPPEATRSTRRPTRSRPNCPGGSSGETCCGARCSTWWGSRSTTSSSPRTMR